MAEFQNIGGTGYLGIIGNAQNALLPGSKEQKSAAWNAMSVADRQALIQRYVDSGAMTGIPEFAVRQALGEAGNVKSGQSFLGGLGDAALKFAPIAAGTIGAGIGLNALLGGGAAAAGAAGAGKAASGTPNIDAVLGAAGSGGGGGGFLGSFGSGSTLGDIAKLGELGLGVGSAISGAGRQGQANQISQQALEAAQAQEADRAKLRAQLVGQLPNLGQATAPDLSGIFASDNPFARSAAPPPAMGGAPGGNQVSLPPLQQSTPPGGTSPRATGLALQEILKKVGRI